MVAQTESLYANFGWRGSGEGILKQLDIRKSTGSGGMLRELADVTVR